jgi:hypothetical protein
VKDYGEQWNVVINRKLREVEAVKVKLRDTEKANAELRTADALLRARLQRRDVDVDMLRSIDQRLEKMLKVRCWHTVELKSGVGDFQCKMFVALCMQLMLLGRALQEMAARRAELEDEVLEMGLTVQTLTEQLLALQDDILQDAADGDPNDGDYEREQPADVVNDGDAQGTTSDHSRRVSLLVTKKNKRHYDESVIVGIQDLVQKFRLKGKNISALIHNTLSLFTGKTMEELKVDVPLPAARTLDLHTEVVSVLRHNQLSRMVSSSYSFLAFEIDEGQISRKKRLATNVCGTHGESRVPVRYHTGAPPIPASSGDAEATGLLCTIDEYNWSLELVLWLISDSCSSMEKAREILGRLKRHRVSDLLQQGLMKYVDKRVLPEPLCYHFVVPVDRLSGVINTDMWIPVELYRNPDMCHIGKNAEKCFTVTSLGGFVSLADGDLRGDLFKSTMMRLARLFAKDDDFHELVHAECHAVGKHFKKIPGVINHRLKILSQLATVVIDHREELLSVLSKFNMAYGGNEWKGDRPTLLHAHEVWLDLQDPRIILMAGVMKRTHCIAEYIYSIFQEEDGFIAYRVASELGTLIDRLEEHARCFDMDFSEDIAYATTLFQDPVVMHRLQQITEATLLRSDQDTRARKAARAAKKTGGDCIIYADGAMDEVDNTATGMCHNLPALLLCFLIR